MFAKLLKHEFKSSKGILGLLTIICLGVAVVATLALKVIIVGSSSNISETDGFATLLLVAVPLLVMAFLAIIAYASACLIIMYVQFYKNKFTDEGYLTFTLPTNVHNLYLSSLANMLIWQVITTVTIIASIAIIILFGTSPTKFINTDLFHLDLGEMEMVLSYAFSEIQWQGFHTLLTIIEYILGVVSSLVLATTCITVGATISKKHKALVAVGIYFGMSYVLSAITSLITSTTGLGAESVGGMLSSSMLLSIVIDLAIAVGGYFLTTHLMEKKLNLP